MANCKTLQVIRIKGNNKLPNKKYNLYGLPERLETDKGAAFISRKDKDFYMSEYIEIEYSTRRLYTGTGAAKRAIQTLKNVSITNRETNSCLTAGVNSTERNAIHSTYGT